MDLAYFVPIALFMAGAAVLCTFIYFRFRGRVEYQKTVRAVIERGQQLTPEFLERLDDGRAMSTRHRSRDLRNGTVSIALGLGIASFGFLLGEDDALRPMIAIGNLPVLIGLALIGLWKFAPREE